MPNSNRNSNKSNRGLASADEQTRKEVARKCEEASRGGGRSSESGGNSGNSGGSSSGKGR